MFRNMCVCEYTCMNFNAYAERDWGKNEFYSYLQMHKDVYYDILPSEKAQMAKCVTQFSMVRSKNALYVYIAALLCQHELNVNVRGCAVRMEHQRRVGGRWVVGLFFPDLVLFYLLLQPVLFGNLKSLKLYCPDYLGRHPS